MDSFLFAGDHQGSKIIRKKKREREGGLVEAGGERGVLSGVRWMRKEEGRGEGG